jgi:hypothetical protein
MLRLDLEALPVRAGLELGLPRDVGIVRGVGTRQAGAALSFVVVAAGVPDALHAATAHLDLDADLGSVGHARDVEVVVAHVVVVAVVTRVVVPVVAAIVARRIVVAVDLRHDEGRRVEDA